MQARVSGPLMPLIESTYRFGPFVLETRTVRLLRDGAPIDVQPKVLELIAVFVAQPGALLTREQLLDALWPDSLVSDSSLHQLLKKTRQALGDDARNPRWIKTVHRKGYRFIGEVHAAEPGEPGALFGRAEVRGLLQTTLAQGERAIVLMGPGGIGKTTLARAVLGDAQAGWFVDLTAAAQRSHVANQLARALDVPVPQGRGTAVERMARPLVGAGAGLVVLDNAEHIARQVAEAVAVWLEAAPDARFLITTRVGLDIRGATVIDLGPLAHHTAAAMLRERVRRRDPERAAALSAAEVQAVVQAVDGVPLALELAADRLLVISGTELAAALPSRTALLRSRRTELSERHRSLDAVAHWSWTHLPPSLRRAVIHLAAFRGPVRTALAERVVASTDGEHDPLLVLCDLHDRSWIQTERDDSGTRVRVLAPLRAFVRATPEARAAWARAVEVHIGAVLDAAPPWSTFAVLRGSADNDLRDLAAELAVIVERAPANEQPWAQAALRLAVVRMADGQADEALAVLAPADVGVFPDRLAARLHIVRSHAHIGTGDVAQGLEEAHRAIVEARAAGDEDTVRFAWLCETECQLRLGDLDRAEASARAAAGAPERDDVLAAHALTWLGTVLLRTHAGDAEAVSRRALALAVRLKDPAVILDARQVLSDCLRRLGRLEESVRETRLAVRAARAGGRPIEIVGHTGNLASRLRQLGRMQEALPLAQWATEEARRLGDANLLGFMAMQLASILADIGEVPRALALLDEATAMFESMPHRAAAAGAALLRGLTLITDHRLERGREVLAETLEQGRALADPVIQWRARYYLSVAALLCGDPAGAEAHADAGLALLTANDGDHIHASGLAYRGGARALVGRRDDARSDFATARALLAEDHSIARYRHRVLELLVAEDRDAARRRLVRLSADPRVAQSQELRVLARIAEDGLASLGEGTVDR